MTCSNKMGEAGAPRRLVLGADIVPDADRDDRRLAVFMNDDAKAVGKGEGLEGNIDPLQQLPDRIGARACRSALSECGHA